MQLNLKTSFWRLAPGDPDDTPAVGRVLNVLGYFTPDPKTGFIPGRPEDLLFESLRKFQSGVSHPKQ